MHTDLASRMTSGTRCLALCICLAVFFVARSARAADLYSYDLDSLVYMSSDIVEAQVVKLGPTHINAWLSRSKLKVTAVHKGKLTPGKTITVALVILYGVHDDSKHDTRNTPPFPRIRVAEKRRYLPVFPVQSNGRLHSQR